MGHPNYAAEANDTGSTHISEPNWKVPCLSRALLYADVNKYDAFKTKLVVEAEADPGKRITLRDEASFGDDLKTLLGHIKSRLEAGLIEAWASFPHGYASIEPAQLQKQFESVAKGGVATPTEVKKIWDELLDELRYFNTPEEKWARAFIELFVFTMYGDPGIIYAPQGGIARLFTEFPRVFPVAVACQQLSSYCILSRGFGPSDIGAGCGCTAGTVNLPCFKTNQLSPKLKGVEKQTAAPSFANTAALASMKMGPGSVVVFNPGGPDYTGQDKGAITHVGSVLRVSGQGFQFVDTGVLVGNADDATGEGGTSDHSFLTGVLPHADTCVGAGVLKDAPRDLAEMAEAMAAARPLGVVRLAVVDVSDSAAPVIRYVSKLLHMRYPLSRLMWSLRGLPVEGLRVLWMVYAVQGTNGPTKSWSEALLGADADKTAPSRLLASGGGNLYEANFVRGDVNGSVVVSRHKEEKGKNGWVNNFEGPKTLPERPLPEFMLGVKVQSPAAGTLRVWALQQRNFGLEYVAKPGAKGATLDEGTVGVDYFDP